MSSRQQALAEAIESAAVDAQALSLRLAALGGVRPSVAAHAQRIANASLVLRDAAIALHGGVTPNLRLFFGQYLPSGKFVEDEQGTGRTPPCEPYSEQAARAVV